MKTNRAKVLLYCRAQGSETGGLEAAYHTVSRDLNGTPGLLANELLRDTIDPTRFIVLSEWATLESFQAWESGSGHRNTTSPMRNYQDTTYGMPFRLCEVQAAY